MEATLGFGAGMIACPASPAQAPPLTYEQAVRSARAPLQATPRDRELVRFATLAANSDNTQPWTFTAAANRIIIAPDFARRCPAVDPDDHHLFVSLGCAAENLVIAASALGLRAISRAEDDQLAFDLEPARCERSELIDAIPARQCTRANFDGRPVALDVLQRLESACHEPGVSALIVTDRAKISNIADYVLQGNSAQMRDMAFMSELVSWMRFGEADALATMDGLFSRCSGNPALPAWIARPVPQLVFTEYREHIESSAGVAILVADTSDKAHWMALGRACQRFGLLAPALGLKYAFVNQPVEVPAVRAQLASFLGIGERRPDIIMRFGAGPDLPKSLRRPPEQVMRPG
jgi:hypothetical protein